MDIIQGSAAEAGLRRVLFFAQRLLSSVDFENVFGITLGGYGRLLGTILVALGVDFLIQNR